MHMHRKSAATSAAGRRWLLAMALLPAVALGRPALAQAGGGFVYLPGANLGGGGALALRVESFQHRRYAATIPQQRDFSCGSAAVATLLTFNYGVPISEEDVFTSMFENGDQAVISQSGFSLLDMKKYLARNQIASEGFRAPLEKLQEVGLPAIVLITVRGYNHFVVVQGIRDGRVLVADPAVGSRSLPIPEFQAQWSGVFFLLLNNVDEAQASFNNPERWAAAPQLPFSLTRYALDLTSLAQPAIPIPGRF